MLALFVSLRAKPGRRDALLAAAKRQGALSREREPGCLRFDVAIDVADPDHVLLYEIYRDQAALDAHRATPNFAEWRAVSDPLVDVREATTATIADP